MNTPTLEKSKSSVKLASIMKDKDRKIKSEKPINPISPTEKIKTKPSFVIKQTEKETVLSFGNNAEPVKAAVVDYFKNKSLADTILRNNSIIDVNDNESIIFGEASIKRRGSKNRYSFHSHNSYLKNKKKRSSGYNMDESDGQIDKSSNRKKHSSGLNMEESDGLNEKNSNRKSKVSFDPRDSLFFDKNSQVADEMVNYFFKEEHFVDRKPYLPVNNKIIKTVGFHNFQNKTLNNEDTMALRLTEFANDCALKYFAIFDGHNGKNTANFLKNELFDFVKANLKLGFPPVEALRDGVMKVENKVYKINEDFSTSGEIFERSGSCALVALCVDNMCYIAWVGDSRAIGSLNDGSEYVQLTKEHNPMNPEEYDRVLKAGGKIT